MKTHCCFLLVLILSTAALRAQDNPQIDLTLGNQSQSPVPVPVTPRPLPKFPASPSGHTLLISQKNPYGGYGYGLGNWVNMTAALNAAFGSANITVDGGDLNSLPLLMHFDRLLVVIRQPGESLSPTEISNIQAYIASGRSVVLLGENSVWATWDSSILATVNGTYSGNETSDNLNRVIKDGLTLGVPHLQTTSDGIAINGTALFSENVATLWGANVLTLLSVNVLDDVYGNTQFETNIAQGLAK